MTIVRGVFGALLLITAIGCSSSSGPAKYIVKGGVKFDGTPVEEGRITFRLTGEKGNVYSGDIKDGAYSIESEPGTASVEIIASKLIPGKFDTSNGTKEPVGKMYIPAKYNSNTTLTKEIAPQTNTIDFDLTTK